MLLAGIALGACNGGSKGSPTPPGGFAGGGADAAVKVADKAWEYKDGICQKGGNDRYLSVNIGNPASDEYFGLVAGQYPGVEGTPKAATGGGEFIGQGQAVVTFRHEKKLYLVKFASTKVTLQPGLAFGIHLSMPAWMLIMVAANMISSVPITPSNIGAYEVAVTELLKALGVDAGDAAGFAIASHVLNILWITVAGFVAMWALSLSLDDVFSFGRPKPALVPVDDTPPQSAGAPL